jgi:L-ascorbate metabolism protein UlaG (beta-lactamase superfamily)
MDITYYGISCFKLKEKTTSVVFDPYDETTGLKLPKLSADIVISSHDHGDHNATGNVDGTDSRSEPLILNAPGEYEANSVSFFGITSYHDGDKGSKRGKNTMFVAHIDDLVIAHLGDLGHLLTKSQVDELSGVDVLLIPVGGVYTIDPELALKVIDQVEPSIVVPMHFKDKGLSKTFDELVTLDEFLTKANADGVRREKKLSLTRANLPEDREIVVVERYG